MDKLWDFFVETLMVLFVPMVCSYFTFSGDLFINGACTSAQGFEKIANQLLIPTHYLFMGQKMEKQENGEWNFDPRFDYSSGFFWKTGASVIAVAPTFISGVICKFVSLGSKKTRERWLSIQAAWRKKGTLSNRDKYKAYGLDLGEEKEEWLASHQHQRCPGDETHLKLEKEALKEIGALLNQAGILWWVDCGTCLGCYRYGGTIPWDQDIDIAVLREDFDNVRSALTQLDPKKYIVQDWSTRDFPKSYLKVYIRATGNLIDVYHFDLLQKERKIQYVLALENNFFFPEWWKVRERRFKVPADFTTVFPLKKALLDGVEVYVPQDTEKYLQRYYGENLAPAKIFDAATGQYEKDLSHPYWQKPYVH